MPSAITGADISALRKRLGLTREALAQFVGYAPSTVRDWERGRRRVPVAIHGKIIRLVRRTERQQVAIARIISALN